MVLIAVWAAGPATVLLCEGVGTLGERLRVQGEKPRDERVVRSRKKMQRDARCYILMQRHLNAEKSAGSPRSSAWADTICPSATVDSEARRARAGSAAERERSSNALGRAGTAAEQHQHP